MHSYLVRGMREEDIEQVSRIDREAFPNDWPPTSYRRELHNRLAHYVVVCELNSNDGNRPSEPEPEAPQQVEANPESPWIRLTSRLRNLLTSESPPQPQEAPCDFIVGFAGLWVMLDEAHLSVIAVRESHRRRGLGELLLLASVQKASDINARMVTLEARVSNVTAHNFYRKFGFEKVGVRRGYYTDNREDAVLMTLHDIDSPAFRERLEQLKQETQKKLARWQAQSATAL